VGNSVFNIQQLSELIFVDSGHKLQVSTQHISLLTCSTYLQLGSSQDTELATCCKDLSSKLQTLSPQVYSLRSKRSDLV
jgi:hypothetical protein